MKLTNQERKAQLQYLEETLEIERLAALEFGLVKNAGIIDMLGGVASAIQNQISSKLGDWSSVGSVGKGLVRIMTPSILFRLHPLVGILFLIGEALGVDIVDIFEKIWDQIKPLVEKGGQISTDAVNSIGQSVVSSVAGPMDSTARNYTIPALIKEAQMIGDTAKEMVNWRGNGRGSTVPKVPWLFSNEKSPIQRIFGTLFQAGKKGKARWLLGGFIIWIVKTILSGAGLLAGSQAIKQTVSPYLQRGVQTGHEIAQKQSHENQHRMETLQDWGQQFKEMLKPSGIGTQYFQNADGKSWVVPLVSGSVEETLKVWITDVYPETERYVDQIAETSAFNSTKEKLRSAWKSVSPNDLTMPKEYHSRKQVVDEFIQEALSELKEKISQPLPKTEEYYNPRSPSRGMYL